MRKHQILASHQTDVEIQGGSISIDELVTVKGHYRIFVLGTDDANGYFLSAVSSQLTPKHDEAVNNVFGKHAGVTSGDAEIAEQLRGQDLNAFSKSPQFHSALLRAPRVYVDKDMVSDGLTAELTAHYMSSYKSTPKIEAVAALKPVTFN